MLAYYGSHILYAAVAYFDVVLVEKGVILVLLREVFRYELKEGFADVSFLLLLACYSSYKQMQNDLASSASGSFDHTLCILFSYFALFLHIC